MTSQGDRDVVVTVGMPEPVVAKLGADGQARAAERFTALAEELVSDLGLTGRASLAIESARSGRVVRAAVAGEVVPLQNGPLRTAWVAAVGPELGALPWLIGEAGEMPFGWLERALLAAAEAGDLPELVAWLGRTTLAARPGAMLAAEPDGADLLRRVERELLSMWIGLGDRDELAAEVAERERMGVSPRALLEGVIARRRQAEIVIEAPPDDVRNYASAAQQPGAAAEGVFGQDTIVLSWSANGWREKVGLRLPNVAWHAVDLPAGTFRVRINSVAFPPRPAPERDELLVMAPVDDLRAAGFAVRSAPHMFPPESGGFVAGEPVELLERHGRVLNRLEYVLATALFATEGYADKLFDIYEAERTMGELTMMWGLLGRAALAAHGTAEWCALLRSLISESVPVASVARIAERANEFDWVRCDPDNSIVLDDRVAALSPDHEALTEFVRRGLPELVTGAAADNGFLRAVPLSDPLTDAAIAAARGSAEERERVRDAIWEGWRYGGGALVVTHGRRAVRSVVAEEFPEIPVLDEAELNMDVLTDVAPAVMIDGASATTAG